MDFPASPVKLPDCQLNWEFLQTNLTTAGKLDRYMGTNVNAGAPHTPGGQEATWQTDVAYFGAWKIVSYGVRGANAGLQCLKAGVYDIHLQMLTYNNGAGFSRYDTELRCNNVAATQSLTNSPVGTYSVQRMSWSHHLIIGDVITGVAVSGNFFEGNTWQYISLVYLGT